MICILVDAVIMNIAWFPNVKAMLARLSFVKRRVSSSTYTCSSVKGTALKKSSTPAWRWNASLIAVRSCRRSCGRVCGKGADRAVQAVLLWLVCCGRRHE